MIGGTLYGARARWSIGSRGTAGAGRAAADRPDVGRDRAGRLRAGLIWFTAVLSINLGLINLFPIPMLDGGHLVLYGIEAARGRPLNERSQEIAFRFGLAMVLSLMVFATWNDLVQFG